MTARLLAPDEWGRIGGGSLPAMLPDLVPSEVGLVAVEDGGAVVAALGVLRVVHLEGLWVDPAHRNAGVERALLRGALQVARKATPNAWIYGVIGDDAMRARVERIGGRRAPADLYVLPLGRG